jgi:hypothetical protein
MINCENTAELELGAAYSHIRDTHGFSTPHSSLIHKSKCFRPDYGRMMRSFLPLAPILTDGTNGRTARLPSLVPWDERAFGEGFDREIAEIPGLQHTAQSVMTAFGKLLGKEIEALQRRMPILIRRDALSLHSGQKVARDYMARLVIDYTDKRIMPDGLTAHDIQTLQSDPAIKKLVEGPTLVEASSRELMKMPGLSKSARDRIMGYCENWQRQNDADGIGRSPHDAEDGQTLVHSAMGDLVISVRRDGKPPDGFTAQDISAMEAFPAVQKYISDLTGRLPAKGGRPTPNPLRTGSPLQH